eukprot:COSAG05_NODE_3007_length_2419_cov_2.225000_3_plen_77_part_00
MYRDATKVHEEKAGAKMHESSWPGHDASTKEGSGSGRAFVAVRPGEADLPPTRGAISDDDSSKARRLHALWLLWIC